ncbi:hypothetical protein B0I37DRAFT_86259 [Chaetomium sp. MPI-CAGE-AT-0009]|nr:hypothetical protein B0I37DRAFT_86259 [Chaetomium sp. MPI-CAGE-AT-0009]
MRVTRQAHNWISSSQTAIPEPSLVHIIKITKVTKLSCEVMAAILRNLDNLRSLAPALLTSRHFHTSFHGIQPTILHNQITPTLLPFSVALLDASGWPRPHTDSSVQRLLDTLYNEPTQLSARVSSIPVGNLWQMARTHELIRKFSATFAKEAWGHLSPGNRDDDSIALSPAEDSRFCRAFYRLELFFQLFRSKTGSVDEDLEEKAKSLFLSRHPPWENEQIACVQEFLEAKFRQASRDVIAHDIFFGELSIDYVSTGRENNWNQLWLSQGLEFVDKVMNANSYEAKEDLLSSAFSKGSVSFPQVAALLTWGFSDDEKPVEEYTQEELLPAASARDRSDLDRGPYEAWFAAHLGKPPLASVMLDENAWLRERAYVLWDWDRMQSVDLLAVVGTGQPEEVVIGGRFPEEEYEMMFESFKERSKLWLDGHVGYWDGGGGT